jgi:hypothetical protein
VGEEHGRVNIVQILHIHHVNGKMTPVETTPGIGGGGQRRMVDGVNLSIIYLIYCKTFYKCYNVLPPSTIKKKRKNSIQSASIFCCYINYTPKILLC